MSCSDCWSCDENSKNPIDELIYSKIVLGEDRRLEGRKGYP
jgi:hypothetical protein